MFSDQPQTKSISLSKYTTPYPVRFGQTKYYPVRDVKCNLNTNLFDLFMFCRFIFTKYSTYKNNQLLKPFITLYEYVNNNRG